uniref:Trafficking protein particle complex subunit n=1 Tax=Mucochytrium quahogii TaxID=96639 RepID=A0A7S2WSV4_9STRA
MWLLQGRSNMSTVGVAFVSPTNSPLFIKRFDDESSLDLLFVIHSALDAVEESQASSMRASRKCYLGLLSLIDGYAVYGYLSNTLIKVIVVLDAQPNAYVVPNDAAMEAYLKKLYFIYVDAVSNPFFEMNSCFQVDEVSNLDPSKMPRYPELMISFHNRIAQLAQRTWVS